MDLSGCVSATQPLSRSASAPQHSAFLAAARPLGRSATQLRSPSAAQPQRRARGRVARGCIQGLLVLQALGSIGQERAGSSSPPLKMSGARGAQKLAIIGAGPIGIEMAAQAVKAGLEVMVLERADTHAGNVREWKHVQLFSSWALNMSPLGKEIMDEMKASMPDMDTYPSGEQYIGSYLDVLVSWLKKSGKCEFRMSQKVISIGRSHFLKSEHIAGGKRKGAAFRLLVRKSDGKEEVLTGIDFLVDSSGTWNQPNWIGMGGMPAAGEQQLVDKGRIIHHIPNIEETPELFLNKKVAVVGAGASAITVINFLDELSKNGVITLEWIVRKGLEPYQRIENDSLPQRDALSVKGNALSMGKKGDGNLIVHYHRNSHIVQLEEVNGDGGPIKIGLHQEINEEQFESHEVEADIIISCCGYRPNDSMWSEVQVHQCFATAGPMKLAAALMASSGGGGDCLAQASHGPETLLNPEPGLFVLGMKSYGRGSAFLLKVGHTQVSDAMELIKEQQQAVN